MSEEIREVKTFEIRKKCPDCIKGYMAYNGRAFSNLKSYYDHTCDSCGKTTTFETTYPRLSYEPRQEANWSGGPRP